METGSEHMTRTTMNEKARESVKRMANKLEARESNGEDMQVIQPERSDALDAHVAEFLDICKVGSVCSSQSLLLRYAQIQDRKRYSFIRLEREKYFRVSEGSLLLVLLSVPEGTTAEISDTPFEFGEIVYINEGVRISGPTVFLRLA